MKKQAEGYILPFIMIVLVILLVITAVAFNQSIFDIKDTDRTVKDEDALYYAEAGFNRYLYFLNEDSKFYKTTKSINLEAEAEIAFKNGFYNLEITEPSLSEPYVTIRSEGWHSGRKDKSRVIEVKVRKRQFTNYVYGTGEETLADGITKVWWTDDDEVNGPLHTNGTLNIDGDPIFNGEVSYSVGLNVQPFSNPEYNSGAPYKKDPLIFPENNSELITWAQSDNAYYQGRTSILLDGDQLKIKNRNNPLEIRDIPANGVIYVDNLNNEMSKFAFDSANVFVSGELDGQLTIASQNTIYITGYDPTTDLSGSPAYTGGIKYADQSFDENSDDILGLTAQRNILILHRNWPKSNGIGYDYISDVSINNITINAAIFALNGSFAFENYNIGSSKGTITMRGSMMQNSRGAVGTFNPYYGNKISGYDKDYSHDQRMIFDTPPHFLEPANSGWEIINWKEIF